MRTGERSVNGTGERTHGAARCTLVGGHLVAISARDFTDHLVDGVTLRLGL